MRIKMREGLAACLETAQQELLAAAEAVEPELQGLDPQGMARKVESALYKLTGAPHIACVMQCCQPVLHSLHQAW